MKKKVNVGGIILIAAWIMVFLSPLMFINLTQGLVPKRFLLELSIPLSMFIVFFVNFTWLAPKYLLQGRSLSYISLNILMISGLAFLIHEWVIFSGHTWFKEMHDYSAEMKASFMNFSSQMKFFYIGRDVFNMSVSATIATAIVYSRNWAVMANRQAVIERERVEMEMQMLKYQINPHFLLNTFNNIYALIAIDSEKAQAAILELSSLFRHMLQNGDAACVLLKDEVRFVEDYISLMRIRLSNHVQVVTDIDISRVPQARIAPLLFISLIENAFKHGVSVDKPSFIHIVIKADADSILCEIINSNHPKNTTDRSGSGIGLEQVRRRLELYYEGKYKWEYGLTNNNSDYLSRIILYDTKLHHY